MAKKESQGQMRGDYGESGPGWTKPGKHAGYGGPPHRGGNGVSYGSQGKRPQSPKKTPATRRRGLLSPTFTALATGTVSGLMAAFSAAAQHLDSTDKALLAVTVGAGTYVTAKIGKAVLSGLGDWGGLVLGGAAGAAAGGALGNFAGRKGEKTETTVIGAIAGGGITGIGAALLLSLAGALAGFWGGAYIGHQYSKDAAFKYLFADAAITPPAAGDGPARNNITDMNQSAIIIPAVAATGYQPVSYTPAPR